MRLREYTASFQSVILLIHVAQYHAVSFFECKDGRDWNMKEFE